MSVTLGPRMCRIHALETSSTWLTEVPDDYWRWAEERLEKPMLRDFRTELSSSMANRKRSEKSVRD